MNNLLKVGVFLGAIAGILAVTNPSKEAYSEYLVWQIKDNYCLEGQNSNMTKVGCAAIAPLPPGAMKPIIEGYTRQKNYVVFSVYHTDAWGMKSNFLGIGGNFLEL
ncbi:MAG: DUF4359 domain-containing protein [Cyanobacteriota bacterium]|nr:DUF4359 domain-containing protein [Cyanobacteriota bacterium]